jgi:hypothetical protein
MCLPVQAREVALVAEEGAYAQLQAKPRLEQGGLFCCKLVRLLTELADV